MVPRRLQADDQITCPVLRTKPCSRSPNTPHRLSQRPHPQPPTPTPNPQPQHINHSRIHLVDPLLHQLPVHPTPAQRGAPQPVHVIDDRARRGADHLAGVICKGRHGAGGVDLGVGGGGVGGERRWVGFGGAGGWGLGAGRAPGPGGGSGGRGWVSSCSRFQELPTRAETSARRTFKYSGLRLSPLNRLMTLETKGTRFSTSASRALPGWNASGLSKRVSGMPARCAPRACAGGLVGVRRGTHETSCSAPHHRRSQLPAAPLGAWLHRSRSSATPPVVWYVTLSTSTWAGK